jgi:hypothetical protein
VEISVLDMLRALKLAENCGKPFAIVGYSNIVSVANKLYGILQYDRPLIYEITADTVLRRLQDLKEENVSLIIGDVIAARTAESIGMESVLIDSSAESVAAALTSAVNLWKSLHRGKTSDRIYEKVLDCARLGIIVFDRNGEPILSNRLVKSLGYRDILLLAQELIPEIQRRSELHSYRQCKSQLLDITGQPLVEGGNQYFVFFHPPAYKNSGVLPAISAETIAPRIRCIFCIPPINPRLF